jgi:hypothetical protein
MRVTFEALANRPLAEDGPVTRMFRAAGVEDFGEAAGYVRRLPMGVSRIGASSGSCSKRVAGRASPAILA